MSRELQLILAILPSLLIAVYLVNRAVTVRPEMFRLSDYFLAGGRIGPTLTTANVLGSNMALANGLWYFVVLGYLDGVLGIIAQVTWCLSLFLVGFLVPTILEAARRGETLHGFLGHAYNSPKLRVACAFVTATGYLLNFGFETYVSGAIIASVLGGDDRLKWVFVIALVLSAAMYISIAGFMGNISQDKKQNFIGIATMLTLAVVLSTVMFLTDSPGSGRAPMPSIFTEVSWTKYLGIIAYTSIFNMVDVSNWQSVAANKYIKGQDSIRALKRAWTKTALLALVFPGAIGVLLGCLLRGSQGIPQTQVLGEIVSIILPFSGYIHAFALGLLVMGFFVLALGMAENLLSAAQFTLLVDVFRRKRYDAIVSQRDQASVVEDRAAIMQEDAFVRGCQRSTFVIAIVSIGIFVSAMWLLGQGDIKQGESKIFDTMFIIFGSAISMFPALLLGSLRARKGLLCDDSRSRVAAWASIGSGYLISISPFAFPTFAELAPVFALMTATIVLLLVRSPIWRIGLRALSFVTRRTRS